MVSSPEKNEQTIKTMPCHSCGRNCRSKSSKLRKKLTEAEREERRVRRVLANRESARLTIRRRQDMYQELSRKAADLSEQNENLNKEKELVMNAYTSLKARNEFLKAQMAKINKAKQVEVEETDSTRQHISNTAIPISLQKQPLFPLFLPFPLCSHQQHSNSMEMTQPNAPLYVLPVPWLLPVFPHGRENMCSSTCSSSENTLLPYGGPLSFDGPVESLVDPTINFWKDDDSCGVNDVSDPEKIPCNLDKNPEAASILSRKRSEEAVVAPVARRRRKELNYLKYTSRE